jgi:N-acetylmuramoyl-L-alanine amidase
MKKQPAIALVLIAFFLGTANWKQTVYPQVDETAAQYRWEKEHPELEKIFKQAESFQSRYGVPREVPLAIAYQQIQQGKKFEDWRLFLEIEGVDAPTINDINSQLTFLGQQLRDICKIEMQEANCWEIDAAKAIQTLRPYLGDESADRFLLSMSYIVQKQEQPDKYKNMDSTELNKAIIINAGHWILPANTGAPNEAAHNMAIANETQKILEQKGWRVIRPDLDYLNRKDLYRRWTDPFYEGAELIKKNEAVGFIEIHGQGDSKQHMGLGTIGYRGTPLNDEIAKRLIPVIEKQKTWHYDGNLFQSEDYNNKKLSQLAFTRIVNKSAPGSAVLVEAVRTPGPAPGSKEQQQLAKEIGRAIAEGIDAAYN